MSSGVNGRISSIYKVYNCTKYWNAHRGKDLKMMKLAKIKYGIQKYWNVKIKNY